MNSTSVALETTSTPSGSGVDPAVIGPFVGQSGSTGTTGTSTPPSVTLPPAAEPPAPACAPPLPATLPPPPIPPGLPPPPLEQAPAVSIVNTSKVHPKRPRSFIARDRTRAPGALTTFDLVTRIA